MRGEPALAYATLAPFFLKVTDMTISIARAARVRLAYAAAIVATLTTLPLSSSAVAADIPVPSSAQVAAVSQWTGFYIGLHGGGGWGHSRLEDPDFQITYQPVNVDSRGALAGAQVGANWQFGNAVIGGELDVSWSSIKGSTPPDPAFFLSGLAVQYQALVTGTGRVGYAAGNLLGYVKGGLAWANVDFKSATATANIDVDHQRTGLTAGAGIEMALLGNLSARVEYDYINFGEAAIQLGTRRNPSNVDHELHLLKLGLNWRFSGDYLVARY
jgi:outer membrane immunogenic protein